MCQNLFFGYVMKQKICYVGEKNMLFLVVVSGYCVNVECVQIVLGYCVLLEDQGLVLCFVLFKFVCFSVEQELEVNFKWIEESVVVFVVVDDWVLIFGL